MVCGRLARRIAWVMFWKRIVTRETLFTFPKPLVHLCHLVNIVLERTVRRGGWAYIDLMSVLKKEFRSWPIPHPSSTPVTIIAIEQKKLHVIHLVLLTLVHHLCTPFCFHGLGPALHPRFHSLLMNRRSAKHIPIVVGSGILKKESIASPKVTRVGSLDLTTATTILQALIRLQQTTAIMIPSENCTLHFSGTLSLLHLVISAITASPGLMNNTSHGNPLATLEVISLALHLDEACWW